METLPTDGALPGPPARRQPDPLGRARPEVVGSSGDPFGGAAEVVERYGGRLGSAQR